MSTLRGYLEHRKGCSVPWGVFSKLGVYHLLLLEYLHGPERPHGTHHIPHRYHDIPHRYHDIPTVLR